MQKITPHLWFDKEAKEAAELIVLSSRIPKSPISNAPLHHSMTVLAQVRPPPNTTIRT